MARCGMCFKDKELTRVSPKTGNIVCKGCWYEIDRVVGYMESIDYSFQYRLRETETLTPAEVEAALKPPKPPTKARRAKREAQDTRNGADPS